MHFRIIILMAQFSLIIMRTTILANLTEECLSCLSYYTSESNKRLPSFLLSLPLSFPPSIVAAAFVVRYFLHGERVFSPPITLLAEMLYTKLSHVLRSHVWVLWRYLHWWLVLQKADVMLPIFGSCFHILSVPRHTHSEQHLWNVFLFSLALKKGKNTVV